MRKSGIWCVAACVMLSACAGGQKVENEKPALMNAGEVVQRYARWLPGESVGVGVIDLDATLTYIAGQAFAEGEPERDSKLEARKQALRADLSKLSRDRLGMDITGAKMILVGAGPIMQTVVLLGVQPTAKDTIEVEGMKAFEILPRHPADVAELEGVDESELPWALALPKGEGVVLFTGRKTLEALAGSDGMSLAKSNVREEYVSALGALPSRAAFVVGTGALAPFLGEFEAEVGFEAPRIVSATFGDRTGVLLRGAPAGLEAIEDMRLEQYETLVQEIEPRYAKRDEETTPLAMALALGYHGTLGLEEAIDVRLEGDTLAYSITTEAFVATAPIGVLAAIAIPAFLRSVKKSKNAESELVMRTLGDASKAYVMSEQRQGTEAEPWHIDATGAQANYPIQWSRYTFPGGTNFVYRSSDEIPTGGGKVMPRPLDELSARERAALARMGLEIADPTYFRYTIETGPGTGNDATMTITAEADFDPTSPEVHTVQQSLYIDATTQEVIVTPTWTVNEFE